MSNREPGRLNEESRYSIAEELTTIEMTLEKEWPSSKSHERTWPRQKPAGPDAVDIARTLAVIIVGGLVGIVTVLIVFLLLK